MNKVSSTNDVSQNKSIAKETFVLKGLFKQAQFSPFFKNYMYLR